MKYEYKAQDEAVFYYGEDGEKFYMIIGGRVGIWVPSNDALSLKARKD